MSALAALIYVARVGQAKADAGTGYELLAITAVVLGGTSIFGGVGTVAGTVLGVATLAVLKNGLQLSDQPSELAGILTGALLLAVLAGEALLKRLAQRRGPGAGAGRNESEPAATSPGSRR
jgi:rhamnose transport system permease protein